MKKVIFVLMMSLSIVAQISAKQEKQKSSKARFSLNLKKGFSCSILYHSQVNIIEKGQNEEIIGNGQWKTTAKLLLECTDVDSEGIITVSQSPLEICIEGNDSNGQYKVDFNSPEKNLHIPQAARGLLHSLVRVKSVKIEPNGKIIAVRQSPKEGTFEFEAKGEISYENNPEWILADKPENQDTIDGIVYSIKGLCPDILGKEITIGGTIKTTITQVGLDPITNNWTVTSIQNNKAQLKLKANCKINRKTDNEFVDEVLQYNFSAEGLSQIDVNRGIVCKSQSKAEEDFRILTFIPLASSRVPTTSRITKVSDSFEIIE